MRRLLAATAVALVALGAACGDDGGHELPPVTTEPAWLVRYEECVAKLGPPPVGAPAPAAFTECLAAEG